MAFIQHLRSKHTAALITSNEVVRIITIIFFLYTLHNKHTLINKNKKGNVFHNDKFILDVVTYSVV